MRACYLSLFACSTSWGDEADKGEKGGWGVKAVGKITANNRNNPPAMRMQLSGNPLQDCKLPVFSKLLPSDEGKCPPAHRSFSEGGSLPPARRSNGLDERRSRRREGGRVRLLIKYVQDEENIEASTRKQKAISHVKPTPKQTPPTTRTSNPYPTSGEHKSTN